MPHPEIAKLDKTSDDAQVKAAVSSCIAYEMQKPGMVKEQAAAMCYSMVREKTGKGLAPETPQASQTPQVPQGGM